MSNHPPAAGSGREFRAAAVGLGILAGGLFTLQGSLLLQGLELGENYFSVDSRISPAGIFNLASSFRWLGAYAALLAVLLWSVPLLQPGVTAREAFRRIFSDLEFSAAVPGADGYSRLWSALSWTVLLGVLYSWFHDRPLFAAEDGLNEYFQFVLLLLSALLLFRIQAVFRRSRSSRWAPRFFLVLAVLFLLTALEEISWGQRIVGIQTPEGWGAVNSQNETNLHNLVDFSTPTLYFLGHLLLLSVLLVSARLRLSGRNQRFRRTFLPHPSLLIPVLFSFAFSAVPVIGALYPWGELQETVLMCAFLSYCLEKRAVVAGE